MATAKTALIIGASRGLGLGLVERLHEAGWQVTATVRDPQENTAFAKLPDVRLEKLDITHREQLDALCVRLAGQTFDLLFINAGITGPGHQSVAQAHTDELGKLFMTNSVAPVRLAERFVPQLREATGVIAFMTSVLGSVACPDAPQLALYKASKAALNSLTCTFVSELDNPRLTVLSFHPGWVKTDMGGEAADIDVNTSTTGLVEQVEAYSGRGGNYFIDYQGKSIPW